MFLTCVFALMVAQPPARPAALNERLTPHWLDGDARFWYRADRTGGREFMLVDSDTGARRPAFDHARLAASLAKAAGADYAADRLPFTAIEFVPGGKAVRFVVGKAAWTCDLTSYECQRAGDADPPPPDQAPPDESEEAPDPLQAAQPRPRRTEPAEVRSPDGHWTAAVKDHNVVVRGPDGQDVSLTTDGTEARRYGLLSWSPDSAALAAFRITPGDDKPVYLVESSPKGGGRAVLTSRPYPLPGDAFTRYELRLFAPGAGKAVACAADPIVFGFPRLRWATAGHTFSYEQVDRGHQRFRLVAVDAAAGTHRNLIDERSKTFVWTTHFEAGHPAQVTWLDKSNEVVHASEASGWRHLSLIDATTGQPKNPITRGEWVVRGIDRVDEDARQVWFRASGVVPGQDPYFVHHYRVNLDGTGLVALTEGNGTHTVQLSPARKYLIDTWSRADKPPVHDLRRADGTRVTEVERADITELAGWAPPEVFTAKGRDGTTDIWGLVHRPKGFDPAKKYPVIESIYAGPHGAFVPKAFSASRRFAALTDLGFVVVQIDGMGTAHRSKAFHDVCWHNLKDAGLPDRILWHKALAAKYPWYDATRVGIYGGSAGGQSATAALLFHGDFYAAAVAGCGCHDNRLDKASWNEQWMGHPVGPQYAASSNIDHAGRLAGKLLLVVGELDTNVPPESTYRLCDALIRAGKDFDFVLVPGAGHGMGGSYGQRRLEDFFVRHLSKQEPPDRNAPPAPPPTKAEVAPKPRPVAEPLDLAALVAKPANEAVAVVRRFEADRGSLTRAYPIRPSATRAARLRKFYADWLAALAALDSTTVSSAAREELAALRAKVGGELKDLEADAAADAAVAAYTPFAEVVVALDEARRRTDPVDPQAVAGRIAGLPKLIEKGRAAVAVGKLTRAEAARAADVTTRVRGILKGWFGFYDGYDPLVTWWAAQPVKQADAALEGYAKFLTDGTTKQPERLAATATTGPSDAPDLRALLADKPSELVPVIERFQPGRGQRGVRADRDPAVWLAALAQLDFDRLSADGQLDYALLRTRLERDQTRQRLAGGERPKPPKDDTGIVGQPIGRAALLAELKAEFIPYSPEELVALARQELAWCEGELKKAAREMGHGDDGKKAVEAVKLKSVPPGGQPRLVRELADEAVAYLRTHDLVTVPPLAAETWRMDMMTAERQLLSPFFTGGEVISVAYPTGGMAHDAKLQSLRGNNPHFSKATVHHELIPGHHLQGFSGERDGTHRRPFSTPFWTEGWACYWEMVLYARGFPTTPEDRVGFLVWRSHRCARVVFSLGYHLGEMTPRQCVDLLTERVGFEPDNALAEVRRSFVGGYPPLYQAGYLVGAMQFRALRAELVDGGTMTHRQFHDAVLKLGNMPVELVRAALTGRPPSRDHTTGWRFGTPIGPDGLRPAGSLP